MNVPQSPNELFWFALELLREHGVKNISLLLIKFLLANNIHWLRDDDNFAYFLPSR